METPTRPLEDFLPLVRPHAPMVPIPLAEQMLRLAAIEFCERTRCWRHVVTRTVRKMESIPVVPIYATIFEIESATFEGDPLTPTQYTTFEQGQDASSYVGTPEYVTQANPGEILIFPFTEPGSLVLSLFLKPKSGTDIPIASAYDDGAGDDYNVVPEFLLVQHGEAIAAGALSRILFLPGQPYSDPQRAAVFAGAFERAADTHFSHAVKGQQRAPARVRGQYF